MTTELEMLLAAKLAETKAELTRLRELAMGDELREKVAATYDPVVIIMARRVLEKFQQALTDALEKK